MAREETTGVARGVPTTMGCPCGVASIGGRRVEVGGWPVRVGSACRVAVADGPGGVGVNVAVAFKVASGAAVRLSRDQLPTIGR